MTRSVLRAAVIVAHVCIAGTVSNAQTIAAGGTQGFLLAGLGATNQQGQTQDTKGVAGLEAPGGWTSEWHVGGGAFLTDGFGVEGGFGRAGRIDRIEFTGYLGKGWNRAALVQRREATLFGGFRARLFGRTGLFLEPVAHLVITREASGLVETIAPPGGNAINFGEPARYRVHWRPGIAIGADVTGRMRRIGLLPGVRFRWSRGGRGEAVTWPGGVSARSLTVHLALRFGL